MIIDIKYSPQSVHFNVGYFSKTLKKKVTTNTHANYQRNNEIDI